MLRGDLFQRLSLDQSLRRVLSVYASDIWTFTRIAAVVVGTNTVVWALIVLPLLVSALGLSTKELKDPKFQIEKPGAHALLLGTCVLLSIVVGAVATGSIVKVVADLYTYRRPDWLRCLGVGVNKAPTLMLAAFLATLGIMAGFMLLLVPGIYLAVAWFVYAPAIVLENLSWGRGLGRSHALVSGEWCYVFCTSLIVALVAVVFQILWNLVLLGGLDYGHTIFSISGSIVSQIPSLVAVPIHAIMQAVMYLNLRVEKEGLNAEVLLRNMGESSADESDPGYRQVTLGESYAEALNDSDNPNTEV